MTYNLKNLNVASLDFDEIKQSLTSFFEQQDELKNLDFRNEASSINMLLNMLSTVTAYNGIYAQFGFTNSFATTATMLESILGLAANTSVLIAPSLSAKTTRTITTTTALEEYSSFNAKATNSSDIFFFNIESVPANTSKSITLYSGSETVFYTNYDYTTQACEVPYNVNPETIGFYETNVSTGVETKWTRVDKSSTTTTDNNTHFTVINGPRGYIVTNNFASARTITTSSKITIKTVISNGAVGNNSTIFARSNTTFGTTSVPIGGYNNISVAQARSALLFKATGQDRCVTLNDYKNAILSSGISGTNDSSKITVANGNLPGQVKVYVTNLLLDDQERLVEYLSSKAPLGISVIYQQ